LDIKRNCLKKVLRYGEFGGSGKSKGTAVKALRSEQNVYDFYGALSCVIKTETIQTALKLIMKGKRVYVGSYNIVKCIEQELIKNQDSGLYNDEEYNHSFSNWRRCLKRIIVMFNI
jgi:hypothetical protein